MILIKLILLLPKRTSSFFLHSLLVYRILLFVVSPPLNSLLQGVLINIFHFKAENHNKSYQNARDKKT